MSYSSKGSYSDQLNSEIDLQIIAWRDDVIRIMLHLVYQYILL
jgi:hypothetical protein